MSPGDPITRALELPSGARFHRCALQVNPHHYAGTFRGQPESGDSGTHARAIVDKAAELEVTVLAVTDHNDVSSVPAFREAAKGRNLHIFPGFELSSREGVHVLCLYPPDSPQPQLERYLGELGVTHLGSSTDLSKAGLDELLRCVREQGGVTIAAHATLEKGLFQALGGQARGQAWQAEDLLAIQIPGAVEDLPQQFRSIVENRNPDYRRAQAAGANLAVAVVNARDVVRPEDLEDPCATCWIKMSEVGVEGLRQAFLDPDSRIRFNPRESQVEAEEHSEIVALAWEGGFLDGAALHLNPNLNVLVGGRGTGKSTVVESVRAVLGLESVGDDARKTHESIVRHVLKSGTKISLLVRACRPARREYRIERTLPNPPLVRDEHGEISKLTPRDVLPRLEVYGQHEISELTKSREKLTRLLDRFLEPDDSARRRKIDLRRELEKVRASLLETREESRRIAERLAALPGLEETLERFREAGLEERLKEQSLLVREERVLASIPERLAPFRAGLESLKREIPLDRVFLSPRALEDLPGKEVLARAGEVLARLEHDLEQVAKQMEEILQQADTELGAVRIDWEKRKQDVQVSYERILRDLQKSRVDGEEFLRLRRQIEELRPLRERQSLLRRIEREQADRRRTIVAEWENLKAEEFRRLVGAARKVSRKLRDRVQVEVTAAGDREPLFRLLREEVGGPLSKVVEALARVPDLSLPRLTELCGEGAAALAQEFGISPGQAERLAKAPPETLLRMEELDLPPTTTIRLNTAPTGEIPDWHALEELSTGQKATAVLLLLLLESDAPLIVDQPEDDLDNRFITEGVVPRMREAKQRRQFLFSTHNANIPVLGDAELIVGLSASGDVARMDPEHMGSIDSRPVRELVEEILEGGKDAFETRRRKYGF